MTLPTDPARDHPFVIGLPVALQDMLMAAGRRVVLPAARRVFSEGDPADRFYLLLSGHVALETHVPTRGTVRFLSLHADDVLGVSWLVPPYRYGFDATAIEDTDALAIDAPRIRTACDADPALGYILMQRLMPVMTGRLRTARLQSLDLFTRPPGREVV